MGQLQTDKKTPFVFKKRICCKNVIQFSPSWLLFETFLNPLCILCVVVPLCRCVCVCCGLVGCSIKMGKTTQKTAVKNNAGGNATFDQVLTFQKDSDVVSATVRPNAHLDTLCLHACTFECIY